MAMRAFHCSVTWAGIRKQTPRSPLRSDSAVSNRYAPPSRRVSSQRPDGHSLGWVELAVDLGSIHAGQQSVRVQELEIELVSGSPEAVLACGRDWVERFGLWLDVQTKAHRGDQLARQAASNTSAPAKPIRPRAKAPNWAAALHAITEQISFNMSELVSPSHHADFDKAPWQHAWLVGLRRLTLLLQAHPEHTATHGILRQRAWHLSSRPDRKRRRNACPWRVRTWRHRCALT